jgi:hypothetical protein
MKPSEWKYLTTHVPAVSTSQWDAEKEGNANLAAAVVKQAVTDYRKLKETKRPMRKIEGSWMVKEAVLREIEDFFKENGGASIYLEFVGGDISASAILRQLKNE